MRNAWIMLAVIGMAVVGFFTPARAEDDARARS